MDELNIRELIVNKCIDKKLTNSVAAKKLGITVRQLQRLKKKVYSNESLDHGNKNKTPVNIISDETKNQILELRQQPIWEDMNFKHFHEYVVKAGHDVSYKYIHGLLSAEEVKSPRSHRYKKPHPRRVPRQREGELLQTDATPHPWFYGNDNNYALHGFIDDATGKVTGLYFCENECMHGYIEAFRQTILNFGIPVDIYSDGLSLFRSKKAQSLSIEEQLLGVKVNETQFARMLHSLRVGIIVAKSSQAKGKVERLWNTLHDRLRIEMGLAKISDIENANKFLPNFIDKYNERFSKPAASEESAFMKLPENTNLDRIFAVRHTRRVDGGNCFSFNGTKFRIEDRFVPTGRTIDVLISVKHGIRAEIAGTPYKVTPIETKGVVIPQTSDSINGIISRFVFDNLLKNEKDAAE
jgi:hypothetical protein